MRIDHLEQVLREARELGVDLELHACGEKREPLEEPFDIGIGTLEAVEPQASRDLRKLLRELPAHLAHVLQLAVVVVQNPWIHQPGLCRVLSATVTLPVSRSISVFR